MDKIRIELPVVVEGKYDKNTLLQIIDATVITTGGFSVFNSKEKRSLIMKLAKKNGIILLTDSDGGGAQIRKFLLGILPKEKVYNLYIPKIEGKERRKEKASKSGLLGVEGMEREVIEKLFLPFAKNGGVSQNSELQEQKMLTKLDFFEDGLSGGTAASEKRDAVAAHFNLPSGMTAKALLEALNIIAGYDEYKAAILHLFA
jgi:ribonuclease M5